jgi:hypothetical protein
VLSSSRSVVQFGGRNAVVVEGRLTVAERRRIVKKNLVLNCYELMTDQEGAR